MPIDKPDAPAPPARSLLILLLLLAAIGLAASAYMTPVSRTQEARVLLTGRDMVGQPIERWLIPITNGEVRLRKPPLAYWLSAVSYAALGRSNFAGRLPAVATGLVILSMTYLLGRRLFDPRVGLLSAGVLFGSLLFFKMASLAETDLYVTAALCIGVWMALRAGVAIDASWRKAAIGWMHGIALMMAIAAMAKGPPALYLPLFLLLLDLANRFSLGNVPRGTFSRRSRFVRFFSSGAIVTFLLLALPWFIYALSKAHGGQLAEDLENSAAGGRGHSASFVMYGPMLLTALLPWSPVWLLASAAAMLLIARQIGVPIIRPAVLWRRRRSGGLGRLRRRWARPLPAGDVDLLPLMCWGMAVFVPLLFWGNKQIHYLLPLMPPAAIGTAWLLGRAHHRQRLILIVVLAVAVGLAVIKGYILNVRNDGRQAAIAAQITREHPAALLRFRKEPSLPFVLAIGHDVPACDDADLKLLADDPSIAPTLVVIDQQEHPAPLPPWLREIGRLNQDGSQWHLLASSKFSIYGKQIDRGERP